MSHAEATPGNRLQVDLRVPVGRPLPELAAFAAMVESAGAPFSQFPLGREGLGSSFWHQDLDCSSLPARWRMAS